MNATPEPTIAITAILVTTAILVSVALIAVKLILGKSSGAKAIAAFFGIFVFLVAVFTFYLMWMTPSVVTHGTTATHGDHDESMAVSVDLPGLPPIPEFPTLLSLDHNEHLRERPFLFGGSSPLFTSLLAIGGTFLILRHFAGRYDSIPASTEQHPG